AGASTTCWPHPVCSLEPGAAWSRPQWAPAIMHPCSWRPADGRRGGPAYGELSAYWFDGPLVEIPKQVLRVAIRIGQGDVAVRPNQVECSALEAGRLHRWRPPKDVERQPHSGASFDLSSASLAVQVGLPVDGRQRRKIIFSLLDRDPGQAVPALDRAGGTCAQR